jgi:exonuclease SbcD
MVKILHISDIHLGGGLAHGRVDPHTGQNTRLQDFVATLGRCIDRAIAEPVDLVLFGGDAFPDATPAPLIQGAFAEQFCRLADAQIPTVLLVGNHDQYAQGQGGASLSIYRTLGVRGFVVGDRLATHCLTTAAGPVQVVTLPWLTRSTLLTKRETEGMSMEAVSRLLLDRLRLALEGEIRRLDPAIPTVLLAHVMTDTARLGAERLLGVGTGFVVPLGILARPEFDYVALGHVHCHQSLNGDRLPPVVYPGSIERVDFSEELEEKGVVLIEIQPSPAKSGDRDDRRVTHWTFCPLPVRRFHTLRVDLTETDDPQGALLAAIAPEKIEDAVVRLVYRIRPESLPQLDLSAVHERLAIAHTYSIRPDLVSQLARPRLPELGGSGGSLDPLSALGIYLNSREDLAPLRADLLRAAQDLLGEDAPADWRDRPPTAAIATTTATLDPPALTAPPNDGDRPAHPSADPDLDPDRDADPDADPAVEPDIDPDADFDIDPDVDPDVDPAEQLRLL